MNNNDIETPDLKDRIQALFLDLIIMFAFSFIVYKIFEQTGEVSPNIRMWTFLSIFVFYDPVFTSFFAGTLGHRAMNLRVKRMNDPTKNVLLPLAIFRFVIKASLGIFSLITVLLNLKGQAIHDLLSGSVVVKHAT